MTLSNNINTISTALDDIHDAIVAKGVTPTGNITTYATAISNISGGSSVVIPREVSANGVYQMPTESFIFSLPSNATSIGGYALYYALRSSSGLTQVDLSNLVTISSVFALQGAFSDCQNLTSANFSNLITVSGRGALDSIFASSRNLRDVDFSNLATISGNGALQNAFYGCYITSLSFPSLKSLGSNYTNQFSNMLSVVDDCVVHFPSNLQSVIGSWSDVISGFGGNNTTVLFDLPATT